MKRKLNVKRLILAIIILILIIVLLFVAMFFLSLRPVDKNNKDISYVVEDLVTPYEIFEDLEKNDIIRNANFLKLYTKLVGGLDLKAGTYVINDSMSSIEIFKVLSSDKYKSGKEVSLTFPEGYEMVDLIEIITESTNITKSEIENKLKDDDYINLLINKYWFLTSEITNDEIYYSLEGYLFPNTYFVNVNGSISDVFETMLDETDRVLSKYREEIENSDYTVHEIMTLASIVEKEAILDEDRSLVASVFYNRLENPERETAGLLQSCATLGYALGEWKLIYTNEDMKVDSPYNTYMYKGLPPGPGNNPGEKSIVATIWPEPSDYYYFMSDVCSSDNKTYFAKTLREHNNNINKYLTC